VSKRVVVRAPAKINLSLGVGPLRDDGFHPLATVYQAIGLFDRVEVAQADELTVTVRADERLDVGDVPLDESNIAVRAALLLAEQHGIDASVSITIDKGIPVAGGMAGGSADGAAALVACNHLWSLGVPREELVEVAAELGSDVPFALLGGTAIGSGRGELVTPVMTRGELWWVVLESDRGLSTPAVYREFDELHRDAVAGEPEIPDALVAALRAHDVEALGQSLGNDLQDAALRLRPELEAALEQGMLASAHGAVLSGSGPSCLFLCEGRAHAERVANSLREVGPGHVRVAPGPVPGARVVETVG
jgi:4-diphosphocytidyl-2-C-methyl-D-erythritol kinase